MITQAALEDAVRQARPVHCTAGTCTRPVYARGLCNPHYRRLLTKGSVEPDKPLRIASWRGTLCRNGCGAPVRAKGLCGHCYNARAWRARE